MKRIVALVLVVCLIVFPFSFDLDKVYASGSNEFQYSIVGSEVFITGYTGQLTDIVIPESIDELSVTTISNKAFDSLGLTSVIIPNSVTTIGQEAFSNNNLTSITIPHGVTSIGSMAFRFNNLTSVTIPETLTSISDRVFSINELESVMLHEALTSIGDFAFSSNSLIEKTRSDMLVKV